ERGGAGTPSGWGGKPDGDPVPAAAGEWIGVSRGRACWRRSHNRGTGENRSPGNQSCRKKMVISGPGVAGYQRNNVSTPPAAARDLAASRPGLGFHLIPVPVHHVDQGAHEEMPGQP